MIKQYALGETVDTVALVRTRPSKPNAAQVYTNTASGCLVYILNPSGAVVVNGVAMTNEETGVYRYSYTIPASGNVGRYLVQVFADDTGDTIMETYFDVIPQRRTTYPL